MRGFQLRDPRLQLHDQLARARQHAALRIEFLARDQVEPAQPRPQYIAEVRLQIFTRLIQPRRHQRGEPLRELVDSLYVDHGDVLGICVSLARGKGSRKQRPPPVDVGIALHARSLRRWRERTPTLPVWRPPRAASPARAPRSGPVRRADTSAPPAWFAK